MYGAELVSLRIAIEFIIEVRYNLRMLGIPIKGACQVLHDNKSVVLSTSFLTKPTDRPTFRKHLKSMSLIL